MCWCLSGLIPHEVVRLSITLNLQCWTCKRTAVTFRFFLNPKKSQNVLISMKPVILHLIGNIVLGWLCDPSTKLYVQSYSERFLGGRLSRFPNACELVKYVPFCGCCCCGIGTAELYSIAIPIHLNHMWNASSCCPVNVPHLSFQAYAAVFPEV